MSEGFEILLHEAAQEQIRFLDAPVAGHVFQPLAADFEVMVWFRWHGLAIIRVKVLMD